MSNIIDIITSYQYQKKTYQNLKKSQEWNKNKIKKYQLKLLINLLNHSYKNVPYYTNLFKENKIKPRDIKTIQDLQKIPFLTRHIVKSQISDLKAKNYPIKKFELKKTGGTTGDALSFYIEKGKWIANHVAYNRIFMERAGYNRRKKTVSILGMKQESKYHPIFRTLELSTFYITDKPDFYINKIRRFKPKFIISYPSAISFLSKYVIENKVEIFNKIEGVFCHGEPLYSWEIDFIKKAFNCKVFDIYGHGEKSVIAATCEKNNYYHVFPEYCIVELIDNKGKHIKKEGEIGELAVTGLHSHIFPFIRYKTGDLGIYSKQKCKCGRNYPIIKSIIGRINEYLITKNEKLIHLIKINELIAKNSKPIKKWQIIQEKKGQLLLTIIIDDKFPIENLKKIKDNFDNIYSKDFDLEIKIVKNIIQYGSSKHHFLIQKLPVEEFYYKTN